MESLWTTEDEAGRGEYIVERSKDGNNFGEVGRVTAKGKSINQYQFSDPFFSLEKVYYRIAAKDAAGKLTYSKIVSIEPGLQKFKLFPNPAVNGRFMVSLPAPKLIKVYNSAGLMLLQKTLPAGFIC